MHDFVYMICAILYTIKTIPPEGNYNKNKTKSPPTAHLNSHKIKFLREFFGKIKKLLEIGGKEDDKSNNTKYKKQNRNKFK